MMEKLLGHDIAISAFLGRFKSGRFPHAWLFEGPAGVGKAHAAHMLAAIVLGAGYQRADGTLTVDDKDDIAHKIATGAHPDFRQVQRVPDNNGKLPQAISVDVVRDMNGFFELRAAQGGYRVAIVDSVDELNANSANALLKTLEEPPPHVKFIFATTEIRKLPVTVLSRCQRFDLRRLDVETLSQHLANICSRENVKIADEGLTLIARAAEGSVRDALSILDQAIVSNTEGAEVPAEDVRDMLGLADHSRLLTLFGHAAQGEHKAALDEFDQDGMIYVVLAHQQNTDHHKVTPTFIVYYITYEWITEQLGNIITGKYERNHDWKDGKY